MTDIAKELKRAQAELRAGSMDRAMDILVGLEKTLKASMEQVEPGSRMETVSRRALLKVMNNLGVVYKNLGDLDSAADALEQALNYSEEMGETGIRMSAGILSNLGLVHSRRRMYSKSLDAFSRALKLAEKHPDIIEADLKIKLHNNRALFYVRFGQPDNARKELSKGLELTSEDLEDENDREREAWLNANLALVHVEIGEEEIIDPPRQEEFYRIARNLFLKSAEIYESEGYTHHHLKQLLNAAEIEVRLGYIEDARKHLSEVRDEAEKMRAGRLLCDIAQVEVELAVKDARQRDLADSIKEAALAFKKHKPSDINSRVARIEGILRRGGQKTAVKLLTDALDSGSNDNSSDES